jgi:hypothetical protein
MTQKQKKQAEKILKGLERQPFYDFYVGENCEFDSYIQNINFHAPKTKEKRKNEMLERITELFDLR